jgi:hypothetical protein
MRKWLWSIVMVVPILSLCTLTAQSKPDLSGTWLFATRESVQSGTNRGKVIRPTVGYLSGAAVNCMAECTIVQDDRTLTISRATDESGLKPPDVVLNLDGRPSVITEIRNSRRSEFTASARWDGGKLVVTHSIGQLAITQTLALVDGTLTVTNEFGFEPEIVTYVRRKR